MNIKKKRHIVSMAEPFAAAIFALTVLVLAILQSSITTKDMYTHASKKAQYIMSCSSKTRSTDTYLARTVILSPDFSDPS